MEPSENAAAPAWPDDVVLDIAMAMEGPHLPVPPGCKWTLAELRVIRWGNLSRQDQGCRLAEARAALAAIARHVAALVAAEREACAIAAECDEVTEPDEAGRSYVIRHGDPTIAAAIRARSEGAVS